MLACAKINSKTEGKFYCRQADRRHDVPIVCHWYALQARRGSVQTVSTDPVTECDSQLQHMWIVLVIHPLRSRLRDAESS